MRYGDLPATTGKSRVLDSGVTILPRQPQMRCSEECEGIYSAEHGDYFWANDTDEVLCSECGSPMVLGHEETRWVDA